MGLRDLYVACTTCCKDCRVRLRELAGVPLVRSVPATSACAGLFYSVYRWQARFGLDSRWRGCGAPEFMLRKSGSRRGRGATGARAGKPSAAAGRDLLFDLLWRSEVGFHFRTSLPGERPFEAFQVSPRVTGSGRLQISSVRVCESPGHADLRCRSIAPRSPMVLALIPRPTHAHSVGRVRLVRHVLSRGLSFHDAPSSVRLDERHVMFATR
jgi:hypothetical protein